MAFEGSDLVLQIAPMRQIRTWAEGALVWQVLALLERLRALADRRTVVTEAAPLPQALPSPRASVITRRGGL
jgi:hypothetical protein